MKTLTGLVTARGLAMGPAFVYRGEGNLAVPAYQIDESRVAEELARLQVARRETRRDLENLIAVVRERMGRADAEVFEGHLMFLEDPLLTAESERYIREEHINAEAAVRKTLEGARAQFERMNDPYFRERVRDLNDVERRLQRMLAGRGGDPMIELCHPSIVLADDLSPSETLRLPREYVLGFAMNGGSPTSHVALLARAMGLPAVTGLVDVTERVQPGETLLLDGTNGTLTIQPDETTAATFGEQIARQKALAHAECAGAQAGTLKDGGEVLIFANVHPGVPVDDLQAQGARGVGLYRSEYLWLNREGEPTEEDQFTAYRDAAELSHKLGEKATVAIRVLDIGGDKLVRGISTHEANPFLGNRSIRYLLANPKVFRIQLRAILRASAFGRIRLMYPMISCVEELHACAQILESVKAELESANVAYDRALAVGAMIEVPAAAINAEALAEHVDFFSIGTNDLVQYTLAADRGNETVAHLYQPTNPAVLTLVRHVIAAAKKKGIPVSVCGETAADPIIGTLWVAMGVDMLSMSATYIPVMARLLARLTRADLDAYAQVPQQIGPGATAAEILAACRAFMLSRIPDLDTIVI